MMKRCLSKQSRGALEGLLEGSRTFLRAKEVKVVARIDGCDGRAQMGWCDGLCTPIIESSVRKVLERAAKKE